MSNQKYPRYEIKTREVPQQTVVTEQSHVTAEELPRWLGQALERQHRALAAAGGAVGPSLVIYHGEVTSDSDGPVEAATPVDPAKAADVTLPVRSEPAHREAYTTITKAQVQFPDILSAYDAVEGWIAENGQRRAGSPREVYFTDWVSVGDDDPACDVAFPIA